MVGSHRRSPDHAHAHWLAGRLPARGARADRGATILALPASVSANADEFTALAQAFKAIDAPVGPLGLASLRVSTRALAGSDATYSNLENKLSGVTSIRDLLAGQILDQLENAEFNGQPLSQNKAQVLIDESYQLLDYVQNLAQNQQ